jgi:uncharacterized protein (DUF1330 family)
MKHAYLVVDLQIEDPDNFEPYKMLTKPIVEKFGGEYLTRGGELHLEQTELWQPNRITIVHFPSMAKAKQFMNSEEYKPVKAIRLTSSKATAVLFGVI